MKEQLELLILAVKGKLYEIGYSDGDTYAVSVCAHTLLTYLQDAKVQLAALEHAESLL